ncbi:hypothetical protein GmHk_04G010197 [Glycine max]|nr:hypothetical protein GmHk_04G010197 [Glycine max]
MMDTNHNHTRLDKDEPQIEEDQRIEEKVREFERRNENGMNDADRWRDMHGFEGYSEKRDPKHFRAKVDSL